MPNILECDICGEIFKIKSLLYKHLSTHKSNEEIPKTNIATNDTTTSSVQNFVCEKCEETFTSESNLKDHLTLCEKPFSCLICQKVCDSEWDLQKHEVKHSRSKKKCKFCDKLFAVIGHLERHEQLHNSEPKQSPNEELNDEIVNFDASNILCNKCSINLSSFTPEQIQLHKLRHRNISTNSKFFHNHRRVLNESSAKTKSKKKLINNSNSNYKRHTESAQSKLYKLFDLNSDQLTTIFDTSFWLHDDLRQITHVGDNDYVNIFSQVGQTFRCIFCSSTFDQSIDLKRHLFGHMSVPLFTCDMCGEQFEEKARLQDHIIQHQLEDTPLTCNICTKSFTSLEALLHHEKSHGIAFIPTSILSSMIIDAPSTASNVSVTAIPVNFNAVLDTAALPEMNFTMNNVNDSANIDISNYNNLQLANALILNNAALPDGTVNNVLTATLQQAFTPCPNCGKQFDRYEKYQVHHQLYHAKRAPFFCAFCRSDPTSLQSQNNMSVSLGADQTTPTIFKYKRGAVFDRKILLLKHLRKYHKDIYKPTKYKCSICRALFSTESSLRDHEYTHEDVKRYNCNLCGLYFRQILSVNNHLRKCHFDVPDLELLIQRYESMANESLLFGSDAEFLSSHLSDFCLQNLPSTSPVAKTLTAYNQEKDDLRFDIETDDCDTVFSGALQRVDTISDADYVDDFFRQPFDQSTIADTGENVNDSECSVYQCTNCGLCFMQAEAFAIHNGIHGNNVLGRVPCISGSETTLECTQCFFMTRDIPIFNAHFHTNFHHMRQNNYLLFDSLKPYRSDSGCDKKPKQEQHLQAKAITTTFFECKTCQSSFSTQMNYIRHVGIHSTILPYECYLCGQAYVIVENLRKHLLIHFEVLYRTHNLAYFKPEYLSGTCIFFHCVYCGSIYDTKSEYQHHQAICSKPCPVLHSALKSNNTISSGGIQEILHYKCVDCHHIFLSNDLYIGHVCLGSCDKHPALPFLVDYGIQGATSQILSLYMPLMGTSSSHNQNDNNNNTFVGATIIQDPFPHHHGNKNNQGKLNIVVTAPTYTDMSANKPQLMPSMMVSKYNAYGSQTTPILKCLDGSSSAKTLGVILPDNPWDERWPKYQTVVERKHHPCQLDICKRDREILRTFETRDNTNGKGAYELCAKSIPIINLHLFDAAKAYICLCCDTWKATKTSYRERKMLDDHIVSSHFRVLPALQYMCHVCGKFAKAGRSYKVHMERHSSVLMITPSTGSSSLTTFGKSMNNSATKNFFVDQLSEGTNSNTVNTDIIYDSSIIMNATAAPASNHQPPQTYLCDHCALCFVTRHELHDHLRTVHNDTTITLEPDEPMDSLEQSNNVVGENLINSLIRVTNGGVGEDGARLFTCAICLREFDSQAKFALHSYTHTGVKPHVCNVCLKTFTKRNKLLEHVRMVHSLNTGTQAQQPQLVKCFICSQTFAHRAMLQEHVSSCHANQIYKCKHCDKTFSHEPHLLRHQRSHNGNNPYTCHICHKDFYRKEKLQRHLFVHDSNTLYKCEICHKGYSTREVLEKHICIREKGCENIVFKCPLCPRKFTFKKNLELHIAHHQTNDSRNDQKKVPKQYYCNLCPKAFVHLKKLNRHLIFHQKYPNLDGGIPIIVEEKKFKCHLCPKTFIKNFYLKKHLENHYKYSAGIRRMRAPNVGTVPDPPTSMMDPSLPFFHAGPSTVYDSANMVNINNNSSNQQFIDNSAANNNILFVPMNAEDVNISNFTDGGSLIGIDSNNVVINQAFNLDGTFDGTQINLITDKNNVLHTQHQGQEGGILVNLDGTTVSSTDKYISHQFLAMVNGTDPNNDDSEMLIDGGSQQSHMLTTSDIISQQGASNHHNFLNIIPNNNSRELYFQQRSQGGETSMLTEQTTSLLSNNRTEHCDGLLDGVVTFTDDKFGGPTYDIVLNEGNISSTNNLVVNSKGGINLQTVSSSNLLGAFSANDMILDEHGSECFLPDESYVVSVGSSQPNHNNSLTDFTNFPSTSLG